MRRLVCRAIESFTRTALLLALLGALHGLLYVPLVHSHEDGDAPAYLASAHALLHGSYTTPIGASTFVTPAGYVDWTWLSIGAELRKAPERQAFRPPAPPTAASNSG